MPLVLESGKRGDVILSSGHKNFHLLFSAAELARRNRLAMLLCGGYPTPFELQVATRTWLGRQRGYRRFLARKDEIPDDLIRGFRPSEWVNALGLKLRRDRLRVAAFHLYGRQAAFRIARAAPARVYHYRAGFGQASVKAAKARGLLTICDHSIVHPALLNCLVEAQGRFPDQRPTRPGGFWGAILADIDQADLVLVNSDFVAETFAFMGADPDRIAVVYQGVEDKFIARLPERRSYTRTGPLKLLFAGGIGPRKGLDEISQALAALPDAALELHLAGTLKAESRSRYARLLADPRVHYHGMLSQDDLAALMSVSDVFVFPTRAEGSARVVFEAMAAGCAVITTRNAGSVVTDGQGGKIVPVNDPEALTAALEAALQDPASIAEMGCANRDLVLNKYRQTHYGDALEAVYDMAAPVKAHPTTSRPLRRETPHHA